METSEDKQWASKYLLDPLTAPEPSQETGPGTHYGSTFAPVETTSKSSGSRGGQDKAPSTHVRPVSDHRQGLGDNHTRSSSLGRQSTEVPTSSSRSSGDVGRSRGSSLGTRYPGDDSNRPLDIIRRESLKANRAPHLRKKQHIGVDQIDRLDSVGPSAYHHPSPYDAASLARNQNPRDSPVRAVARTNHEALRATPREKVVDSIKRHRPLDGVAMTPPGHVGPSGEVFNYEEGTDLMIENGGNYKRWPDVEYHPNDLKGKGEPSYSIERALKGHEHPSHQHHVSDGGVELANRSRAAQRDVQPANTTGSSVRPAGGFDGSNGGAMENGAERSSSARTSGGPLGHLRRRRGSNS